MIAILMHEIPHEIGDYAILISSGMSARSALKTQIVTAIGAIAGTILGILVEGRACIFIDF